jgi:GNAT superfamily N-acetyltransferase
MSYSIREGLQQDAQVIAEFNTAMAWETEHKRLDPPTVLAGVRQVFTRPGLGRYFVAVSDQGEVIGQLMLTYEWSDWRNGVFWWIQSVYVRPDWRRTGVFRSLYRHVYKLAREGGEACGIRLYVEQANERAMATYRELGMVPGGYEVYETDWVLQEGGQRGEE